MGTTRLTNKNCSLILKQFIWPHFLTLLPPIFVAKPRLFFISLLFKQRADRFPFPAFSNKQYKLVCTNRLRKKHFLPCLYRLFQLVDCPIPASFSITLKLGTSTQVKITLKRELSKLGLYKGGEVDYILLGLILRLALITYIRWPRNNFKASY